MNTTKYDQNEIMRLIGKQRIANLLADGGAMHDDMQAVLDANKGIDFESAIDFVILGLLYGERIEDCKANGKPLTPITHKER